MVRALSRHLLFLGIVSAACLAPVWPAQAADFRSGAARQEITGLVQDDVYVAGETVTIPGVVSGDVVGFGRRFVVGGTVGGSVVAGAETVEISGGVGQSARVGARIVEVSGSVGGDLLAGGQSVLLSDKSVVNRDVLLGAQEVEIEGQVGRHVKGGAQSLTIAGTVKGDVQVETDKLMLGPAARIEGNLIYTSEDDADIRPGAMVLGRTERREPRPETVRDAGYYVVNVLRGLIGPIVLGLLVLWLVPGPLYATSGALRSAPLVSLGLGLVTLIAVPLVVLFLFILASITGAGFSVPFALGGIFAVLLLLAKLIFGLALGSLILRFGKDGVEPSVIKGLLALIVGVVLLALVSLVPILGGIVSALVTVMSLGAVIVAFVRWRRARDMVVAAPPATEASTPA
jgi:cytoskeletal protein CcmA (bactofilin family)